MQEMTIGQVAEAAGVGVETIRFYHQRKLLPLPATKRGAFRVYQEEHAARIRFIKRAQELGFTLKEVQDLLRLNDGTGHRQARALAQAKLAEVERKLKDLQRMRRALSALIHECEHTGAAGPCPIIHLAPRG